MGGARTRVGRRELVPDARPVLTTVHDHGHTVVLLAVPVLALASHHLRVLAEALEHGRRYQPDETRASTGFALFDLQMHGLMDGNQLTDKGREAIRLATLT